MFALPPIGKKSMRKAQHANAKSGKLKEVYAILMLFLTQIQTMLTVMSQMYSGFA